MTESMLITATDAHAPVTWKYKGPAAAARLMIFLLFSQLLMAREVSAPVGCFATARGSRMARLSTMQEPKLIYLCSGATNITAPTKCFEKALATPRLGALEDSSLLHLCARATDPDAPVDCYSDARVTPQLGAMEDDRVIMLCSQR